MTGLNRRLRRLERLAHLAHRAAAIEDEPPNLRVKFVDPDGSALTPALCQPTNAVNR